MLVYGKYECFAMQMLYVCVLPVIVWVKGRHLVERQF